MKPKSLYLRKIQYLGNMSRLWTYLLRSKHGIQHQVRACSPHSFETGSNIPKQTKAILPTIA